MILSDSPIPRDWFDWSNASVGIVGLAFTLGAVRQASGAKKAAQDARQAVYRRNASDDLRGICELAATFLTAIETKQKGLALHIARDFLAACSIAREHHRGFLGADGGKLEAAADLIASVSRGIQDGYQVADYIANAQKVVRDLNALAGTLNRKIEEQP
jgi:hypothetical protein